VIKIKKHISYISDLSLVKPNLNFSSNIDLIHKDDEIVDKNTPKNGVKGAHLKGKR